MTEPKTHSRNNKVTMSEAEKKAFQLLTISRFILARTPTVLGYVTHYEPINKLSLMTDQLSTKFSDINEVVESQEWRKIRKILSI